jgi:hypothetical protein
MWPQFHHNLRSWALTYVNLPGKTRLRDGMVVTVRLAQPSRHRCRCRFPRQRQRQRQRHRGCLQGHRADRGRRFQRDRYPRRQRHDTQFWKAFKRVKANRGAAGVDKQSIAGFEADLSNNLYKLWNRMCSGSYFPPPVRRVEIPKADGGMRPLGIPMWAA